MHMMGFGLLFPLLIGGAIAYAAGWRPEFLQGSRPSPGQSALDVLKERYARGGISKAEYEQMRQDLMN
jgi:putative membrane protein